LAKKRNRGKENITTTRLIAYGNRTKKKTEWVWDWCKKQRPKKVFGIHEELVKASLWSTGGGVERLSGSRFRADSCSWGEKNLVLLGAGAAKLRVFPTVEGKIQFSEKGAV